MNATLARTPMPAADLDQRDPAVLDQRDPAVRLAQLLHEGCVRTLHEPDNSGVLATRGRILGRPVVAYCTDARAMGGAMGGLGCRHIVDAITTAGGHHPHDTRSRLMDAFAQAAPVRGQHCNIPL